MSVNKTILVVDDDDDNRSLVKTILSSHGYNVEECSGGAAALERLMGPNQPALVILDLMMPEVSGYDVLVHMKQRPETQNIPVIFLTAKGEPEDVLSGYKDYGVEYYITKPFTSRQLLAGIKLYLS